MHTARARLEQQYGLRHPEHRAEVILLAFATAPAVAAAHPTLVAEVARRYASFTQAALAMIEDAMHVD